MKKIKLLSLAAIFAAAFAFTSCNSDSGNGFQWPSEAETAALFSEIQGSHGCGLLLPASINESDESKKFDKDSLSTYCNFRSSDSTLTVANVEVSKFAKYISNETIKKEVAELPNQTMNIKLIPYSYDSKMFLIVADDIQYTNSEGKVVRFKFYGGATNYSTAFIGTRKDNQRKELAIYLTPGAITVENDMKTDALKTYNYQGYQYPYQAMLEVSL